MNPFRRGTIGMEPSTRVAPTKAQLVEQARRNRYWQELDAAALEEHGRCLVDRESGHTYMPYRADPRLNEGSPLAFTVVNSAVSFYERMP